MKKAKAEMTITESTFRGEIEMSVEHFVERGLDGADYGQGQLEDLKYSNEKVTKAFARLIEVLANKHRTLNESEVFYIVKGYERDDE